MNAYKTAFEGLTEIIRMGQDDNLIQIVNELEGDLKQLKESAAEEGEGLLEKSEWDSMGYKEKLALKKEQPEAYSMAQNGQFKEMI